MQKLSDLPNISKVIESKLHEAGIETPEQLNALGAEQAFLRISEIDESACINMLCALEGAIQNIRWHHLPKERKEELKHFLNLKKLS